MSTRCQITVIQEGLRWERKVTLYKHTDGYPANIIPKLKEAYELATHPFGFGNSTYQSKWEAGRAGKVASYICATQPGSFEPEEGHQLHGDIEYYYRLYVVNKKGGTTDEDPVWEVEIYTPSDELVYELIENWQAQRGELTAEFYEMLFDRLADIENMVKILERTPLFEVNLPAEDSFDEDDIDIENVETIGTVSANDLEKLFDEIDSLTRQKEEK